MLGIGAATAVRLAAKGCNLLLVYTSSSSRSPTETLCAELSREHGVKTSFVQADLRNAAQGASAIVQGAKDFFASYHEGKSGDELRVDILINCAGVSSNQFMNDQEKGPIETEEFERVYAVNVLAPLLLTQAISDYLPRDRSGRIVNVSSVSSSIGYHGQSVYAGSKAALEAMTRTWSRELASRATVNAVNPGPAWGDMYAEAGEKFWRINQPFVDAAPLAEYDGEREVLEAAARGAADQSEEGQERERRRFDGLVREKMGSKRPGFTSEIAGTIEMLCMDEAGWTTGSVVCANGGMKMTFA